MKKFINGVDQVEDQMIQGMVRLIQSILESWSAEM